MIYDKGQFQILYDKGANFRFLLIRGAGGVRTPPTPKCYRDVTGVVQECYRGVTGVLPRC